jgi:Cu-Zn family superoxide dismutase
MNYSVKSALSAVVAFVAIGMMLSSCSSKDTSFGKAGDRRQLVLNPVQDSKATGSLEIVESSDSLRISGLISGLEPGPHGFQILAAGSCSGDSSDSDTRIFALPGQIHGAPEDSTSSIGVLGNIRADERGQSVVNVSSRRLCMKAAKECSILGRSIVVRSRADDFETRPSGDSGRPVACAQIPKES